MEEGRSHRFLVPNIRCLILRPCLCIGNRVNSFFLVSLFFHRLNTGSVGEKRVVSYSSETLHTFTSFSLHSPLAFFKSREQEEGQKWVPLCQFPTWGIWLNWPSGWAGPGTGFPMHANILAQFLISYLLAQFLNFLFLLLFISGINIF